MTAGMRNVSRTARSALILLAVGLLAAGCGSSGGSGGTGGSGGSTSGGAAAAAGQVPTANLPTLKTVGKGEGTLNLIAWEGYLQPQWVKPFENQTGCQVHATYAGTSDQMVTLMKNKKSFPVAPTSWNVIYSPKYKGQVTVPDNPIQIADAALYLKAHNPALKITDPYELTQPQFQASVKLLAGQRPLIKKYWGLASQEISEFKNGDATVGAGWPYQVSALKGTNFPIGAVIPKEGATGWADTWMLAAKAPHPNCAYQWMRYISTPKVQAEQAVSYGETPDNKLACPLMNKLQKGSCDLYHANAPKSYFDSISLWKTPVVTCDNGQQDCVPS